MVVLVWDPSLRHVMGLNVGEEEGVSRPASRALVFASRGHGASPRWGTRKSPSLGVILNSLDFTTFSQAGGKGVQHLV